MSVKLEFNRMSEEDNKELLDLFLSERVCWYQVGPKKFVVPYRYKDMGESLYNFKLRPDDVFVATYPRSGTTLTQELVWLLLNDFDYEGSQKVPQILRFPQLEHKLMISDDIIKQIYDDAKGDPVINAQIDRIVQDMVPVIDNMPGKRFIKTHLPLGLLNPSVIHTCKVVYVCRNPKDVAVSFYHLSKTVVTFQFTGDFAQFWNLFETGKCRFCPYWEHVKEAWALRDHPNMLFIFYDDLVKDMEGTIRKVATHFGKAVTNEQVKQLATHLHISNFRNNKAVNMDAVPFAKIKDAESTFIRQGKVDGWKDVFTPELNERADKWIAENMARIPGFTFPVRTK